MRSWAGVLVMSLVAVGISLPAAGHTITAAFRAQIDAHRNRPQAVGTTPELTAFVFESDADVEATISDAHRTTVEFVPADFVYSNPEDSDPQGYFQSAFSLSMTASGPGRGFSVSYTDGDAYDTLELFMYDQTEDGAYLTMQTPGPRPGDQRLRPWAEWFGDWETLGWSGRFEAQDGEAFWVCGSARAVPEPTTAVLVGLGLTALGSRRRAARAPRLHHRILRLR